MKIYTLNDILKTKHLGHERYIRIEEIEQLDFLVEKYVHLIYKQTGETVRRYRERILEEMQQALKEE